MEAPGIFETADGSHSIFSATYGVSYHSRYGAVQESQHVFIDAALRYKAVRRKSLDILEIGFGSGLNAFMTLLEAKRRHLLLRYTAIEAYPITLAEAERLNFHEALGVPDARAEFLALHRLPWGQPQALDETFVFCKLLQRIEDSAFEAAFDIIYFDAFAPNAQPELWEAPVMARMFEALRPEGVLVTYCAKGAVKRTLRQVGFEVESLPGPPRKREMTRALKG